MYRKIFIANGCRDWLSWWIHAGFGAFDGAVHSETANASAKLDPEP
jgi:hypothetical protein